MLWLILFLIDLKIHPNCYHTKSSSKTCENINGNVTCETLNRIFRECPGVNPIEVFNHSEKSSGKGELKSDFPDIRMPNDFVFSFDSDQDSEFPTDRNFDNTLRSFFNNIFSNGNRRGAFGDNSMPRQHDHGLFSEDIRKKDDDDKKGGHRRYKQVGPVEEI